MRTLKDQDEVKEVELEENSEEAEDRVDATIVMNRVTWLEIVLIQGDHGSLTAEPTNMQLKTAQR